MGIFSWIILGLIAGFIGSKIVDQQGQGLWLNIALGIIGALVGGFLFSFFGSSGVTGLDLWSMIVAIAGSVGGGLGGLLDKLQKGGLGNAANSWVGSGQNQPASPGQLGSALGPEIIKILAQRSGLSEEEITKQLSQVLPGVVDKLTPQGRLPTVAELSELR